MKTNVTYVDAAKFEALCLAAAEKHGFRLENQKGFVRVQGPAGRRIYVANTKRVGRVDLSGFEMRDPEGKHLPGYVAPHCGPFGNVKQQLDMSLGEEAILENFAALLEHLATLAPAEKEKRAPQAAKKDEAVGWTVVKKERLGKIKKAAKKDEEAPASSPTA